jgi:pSer/pThr/pTyr-binding forkhead associated (FHA) protein
MATVSININAEKIEDFEIDKKSFSIGRSKDADITLAIEGISRKHLQIDIEDDQIFVTDLNSSNGVFINEEKIEAGVKTLYMSFIPMTICANTFISITL